VELGLRAELLDEGLKIVTGLWTGEPFAFSGRHFKVSEIVFQPTPVQHPRVPIWVGGLWPRRGPIRRAARWDGAMLGWKVGPEEKDVQLHPDDLRALVEEVQRHRGSLDGYEFIMGGGQRPADEDAERERLRAMAAAGATWWMEWVAPSSPEEALRQVARGPLGV